MRLEVLKTTAPLEFAQLVDEEGRLWLMPLAVWNALRAQGLGTITPTISLTPGEPPRPWLTLTEAAILHAARDLAMLETDDLDELEEAEQTRLLNLARVKLSAAIRKGAVRADGHGTARRIDPASFGSWRAEERDRALKRNS